MKGTRLLFGIVIVLLITTSVLPGCNKEQQLVIPSSLSSYEVFNRTANAGPPVLALAYFGGTWSAEDMPAYIYELPQGVSGEQFIEGFEVSLLEFLYIKRNGERIGDREDKLVSYIAILKYEDTESAERSFIGISEAQGLQNLTYGGIVLKNGTHALDPDEARAWEAYELWDESTMPFYLIHSGCFVIYLYGRDDVANDILDRIIVAFGVKATSNQSQAGNTT